MLRFASFASLHMSSCRLGGWSIMMRTACRDRKTLTSPPWSESQSSSSVGMMQGVPRYRPLLILSHDLSKRRGPDVNRLLKARQHQPSVPLLRPGQTLLLRQPEVVGGGVDGLLQEQIHLFSSKHVRQSWGRDSSTGLSGKSFKHREAFSHSVMPSNRQLARKSSGSTPFLTSHVKNAAKSKIESSLKCWYRCSYP